MRIWSHTTFVVVDPEVSKRNQLHTRVDFWVCPEEVAESTILPRWQCQIGNVAQRQSAQKD